MIQLLPDIYSIQARAQRATLKGDLDKAVTLLRDASVKYQELIDQIDHEDEDNFKLIKSIEQIRSQVVRRIDELEIILQSKLDLKETKILNNDDNLKNQISKLIKQFNNQITKSDSNIIDLRNKLEILKINGNNIDLVTTPEQKLKYENDLLHKIQIQYDIKSQKQDSLIRDLISVVNGNDLVIDDQQDDVGQRELQRLQMENDELKDQVNKLNYRWNDLLESAKKRKERELK